MLVLVAPGQGAQAPGFLTPWLDLPGAADRLAAWSQAIDLDLIHYGTKADADAIRDTAVAQPLLVAAGLLSAAALDDTLALGAEAPEPADTTDTAEASGTSGTSGTTDVNGAAGPAGEVTGAADARSAGRVVPGAVAGHSVGEITAAVLSGVLDETTALTWVRERGLAMAEASAVTETGMAALLGGAPEVVLPALEKLGLTAANVNGAGQIVAAGTAAQLAALAADKPEGVRRVVPLKVAGAFHTGHMAPAVARLARAAATLAPADPVLPFVSNRDGAVVATGAGVLERLVGQVANPVRWDLCMDTFRELGATALLELCPGGTLTGLAKRALPGVRTLPLKTPADLDTARALVRELAASGQDTSASAEPTRTAASVAHAANTEGRTASGTAAAAEGSTSDGTRVTGAPVTDTSA